MVQRLEINLKSHLWRALYKDVEKLLKTIMILDIEKIKELINEVDEAYSLLCDKDIVLLLGPTGCGKSMK